MKKALFSLSKKPARSIVFLLRACVTNQELLPINTSLLEVRYLIIPINLVEFN